MCIFSDNTEYQRIEDDVFQTLKKEKQNEYCCKIFGYKYNATKNIFYHIICILLLGIPYFLFNWLPICKIIKYDRISLKTADIVLLTDEHGKHQLIEIKTRSAYVPHLGQTYLRYFYYQHTQYVFHEIDNFIPLDQFVPQNSLQEMLEYSSGLNKTEYRHFLDLYGPNDISVEVKSYWSLFTEEVFHPFYIFQIFSITLWCTDDYFIYAGCVSFLMLISIATSLYQTRSQSQALHDLVESSTTEEVVVSRPNSIYGSTELTVDSKVLVPGDLLVIPPTGCTMACDAVLLTGNCIVNESVLTGESLPITKTPPQSSSEIYSTLTHKRHTLFAGTHVLQTRYYEGEQVLARVVSTGFDTTKGSLIKSILYPAPIGLKFYKDSFKFLGILFVIAAIGMITSFVIYTDRKIDILTTVIRSLDIFTIVVPPALPAAMTVATVYSQNRLKKLGIFCISPQRINICGKIKLACFDKTGTLTNEGLEIYSVIPCEDSNFIQPVIQLENLNPKSLLIQAMATCHGITRIEGNLIGDPLDINMFESINWSLEEPGTSENSRYDMLAPTVVKPKSCIDTSDLDLPYEIGVIRNFPFSSNQQCMSVICRSLENPQLLVFSKGAPEKVSALCQQSTLPHNFSNRLTETAAQGFRVIALAYKQLPKSFKWKDAQKVERSEIEKDLIFLGLLIMRNTLKPESQPTISILKDASIRTVMITGDNIRTAIAVGRECGMIGVHQDVLIVNVHDSVDSRNVPPLTTELIRPNIKGEHFVINTDSSNITFAIDGKTWTNLRIHYAHLIPRLLVRTTVFARFQPDQKTQLVLHFQKLDYVVSMVGDGTNDCGALKAAHVGVSLSRAEASVAAPFTSSIENISCILHLILEGRCALVTSFAMIKYMAAYSLIQFTSVMILYILNSLMGDTQFLFIDLVIITSLALTIGNQGPSQTLGSKRPLGSLLSGRNLVPFGLQILVCVAIQVGSLQYLFIQFWYTPSLTEVEPVITKWENTVVFCVSCFQYLIFAFIYSKGKPFRESILTNVPFLIISLALTSFITWLTVCPIKEVANFFELIYVLRRDRDQIYFKASLILFPILNLILSILIEFCFVDRLWFQNFLHTITLIDDNKNYQLMEIKTRSVYVPHLGRNCCLRHFYYQHTQYVFHEDNFVPLDQFVPQKSITEMLEYSRGLYETEYSDCLALYGPNHISIEVKSYWTLFIDEVFHPFYIFQILSLILWCFDNYYIYASLVFFFMLVTVATSLNQIRSQCQNLHDRLESSTTNVTVLRANITPIETHSVMSSKELVPGDLLVIPPKECTMTCDAVLLKGNCIVDESVLTGESIPVTKTPPQLSPEIYSSITHKRHTLFAGTRVLQSSCYEGREVLARVVSTGFHTTKGSLIKNILYPAPISLKFYKDSYWFLGILFGIAVIGMTYSVIIYTDRNVHILTILIRSLDIFTIVVPPALPAAITIATVYSQQRLKKLGIFCISPQRINICGKINLVCFDKTGTLTNEGLDFNSVIPCMDSYFIPPWTELETLPPRNLLIQAMATCHDITTINGTLIGDHLDIIMFESVKWKLEEPKSNNLEEPGTSKNSRYHRSVSKLENRIDIIRNFQFSSNEQCMSVICKSPENPELLVFTKGAPEKISDLCQPETLPGDFQTRFTETANKGYRVVALAYKKLITQEDPANIKRSDIERDLIFLGLLIMQNKLKPESERVIYQLKQANIKTVMITGDNMNTAIAVGKECGMIDEQEEIHIVRDLDGANIDGRTITYAIDGEMWKNLITQCAELIPRLLVRTTIFARFQPDQKAQLVLEFQKLDYVVAMIGDGANDCGALKAAHVGVSLSNGEASVSAPFTSSIKNISCILHLMLEGRCALVTIFSMIKYVAAYSLIQFTSVMILYKFNSLMGNFQFLFIDLVIIAFVILTIGNQGPCRTLGRIRPSSSLISGRNLIPFGLQIVSLVSIQVLSLYYLFDQSWYKPLKTGVNPIITKWENTVVFCVSGFQYLIFALIYSKGKPFRESYFSNGPLFTISFVLTCFMTWLTICPVEKVANFFELIYVHRCDNDQFYFKATLVLFPIFNLVIAVLIEFCFADRLWFKNFLDWIACKYEPKSKYKQLLKKPSERLELIIN
ncbi:hypothetical protein FQR65_LT02854 [Abscondita terminalis]|nr:hypothetical protein FQR65_LT02854 [Abscondita terminalis]